MNKLHLKVETQHFIINYNEEDKDCQDDVASLLESSYFRIAMTFEQKFDDKLIIEIYTNLKELHLALGFPDAPDWIRGGLGSGKIIIASPLNPPPGSGYSNVVNTAVHEFIHIILNKINNNIPRWLDDGVASFEAKDNNEVWIKNTIKQGIEENAIPLFNDLDTGDDFETFFKRNGYQYSYSIIEFVVEEFGYEKLLHFIKNPRDFKGAFGLTEDQFRDKWVDYLKDNYR